eukprot:467143_1
MIVISADGKEGWDNDKYGDTSAISCPITLQPTLFPTVDATLAPSLATTDYGECWTVVDTVNKTGTTLPRGGEAMAVGYDTTSDTIVLLGGRFKNNYDYKQLLLFKDGQFEDWGDNWLPSQTAFGYAQYYSQLGNKLYMINYGTRGSFSVCDLSTKVVTDNYGSVRMSEVGEQGCLVAIDSGSGYLMVLGSRYLMATKVQILNLANNQWLTNVPQMNVGRQSFACVALNNEVYAIGGLKSQTYDDSIEVLNVNNMANIQGESWSILTSRLLQPMIRIRAVTYQNDIIILGGWAAISQYTDINVIDSILKTVRYGGRYEFTAGAMTPYLVYPKLYLFGGWLPETSHQHYDQYYTRYYQYYDLTTTCPSTATSNPTTMAPTTNQPTTNMPTTSNPTTNQPTDQTNTVITCPIGNAHSFDWDTLTSNAFGKPEITYTINVDESANTDLALNIEVRVPYIVRTKADDQNTANFGTTYVLDFEDFNAHKSLITEPNSCSNRLSSSYT